MMVPAISYGNWIANLAAIERTLTTATIDDPELPVRPPLDPER